MEMIFGGPKTSAPPPPPPPPPAPVIEDAASASQASRDAMRRRKGMQASVLTSPEGVGSSPVGTKTLLGG